MFTISSLTCNPELHKPAYTIPYKLYNPELQTYTIPYDLVLYKDIQHAKDQLTYKDDELIIKFGDSIIRSSKTNADIIHDPYVTLQYDTFLFVKLPNNDEIENIVNHFKLYNISNVYFLNEFFSYDEYHIAITIGCRFGNLTNKLIGFK